MDQWHCSDRAIVGFARSSGMVDATSCQDRRRHADELLARRLSHSEVGRAKVSARIARDPRRARPAGFGRRRHSGETLTSSAVAKEPVDTPRAASVPDLSHRLRGEVVEVAGDSSGPPGLEPSRRAAGESSSGGSGDPALVSEDELKDMKVGTSGLLIILLRKQSLWVGSVFPVVGSTCTMGDQPATATCSSGGGVLTPVLPSPWVLW